MKLFNKTMRNTHTIRTSLLTLQLLIYVPQTKHTYVETTRNVRVLEVHMSAAATPGLLNTHLAMVFIIVQVCKRL